jgi:hypothetical protein
MIKPISPKEVVDKKRESIPDFVIEAFNQMIAENWDGKESRFRQDEVVTRMFLLQKGLTQSEIQEKNLLDVEEIYRKEGWIVEYDKGDYNTSDPSIFTFRKSKRAK